MEDSIIEIKGLTKKFGSFTAVENLSIEIKKGEIFGLLGENGAGKTTLIRVLCGVLKPTHGTIYVNKFDIKTHATEIKRKIGYLPEEPNMYERMTPVEFLKFYAELYKTNSVDERSIKKRTEEVLTLVGLTERANNRISTFSKGMRQRLSIARAIFHEPEILILDEPTMGLDPVAAFEIRNFVLGLKGKKTVIVATHYLDEAEMLCDRAAVVHKGKFTYIGSAENLKEKIKNGWR